MPDFTGVLDLCAHHRPDRLSYIAAHADADRRLKRGERQTQCPDCKRWLWKHEMGVRSTANRTLKTSLEKSNHG